MTPTVKTIMMSGAALAGLYAMGYVAQPRLKHFAASEFGAWWPLMNPLLLKGLDRWRAIGGYPIEISPALGALGRPDSSRDGSQHIPRPWVNAADVMPVLPPGKTLRDAYRDARSAGIFTGIGLYPDWRPRPGMHVDVRTSRTPDNPALWSAFTVAGEQQYYDIDRALA